MCACVYIQYIYIHTYISRVVRLSRTLRFHIKAYMPIRETALSQICSHHTDCVIDSFISFVRGQSSSHQNCPFKRSVN